MAILEAGPPITPTMRGLARIVLEDPRGELGVAAGLALARVVLEVSGDTPASSAP